MGDEKLRARLARTTQGCRRRELDRLYVSFGFEKREGKKHTIYTHPRYPRLQAAVARHTHVHRFYVDTALKLLADLDVLKPRGRAGVNLVSYYMALPYGVDVIHEESGDAPPYVAFIRELPGCMAQGRTPAEALQELHEAKYLFIEAMLDHGIPIPAPMPAAQPPVLQGELRLSIPEHVPQQPETTTPSVRLVPA